MSSRNPSNPSPTGSQQPGNRIMGESGNRIMGAWPTSTTSKSRTASTSGTPNQTGSYATTTYNGQIYGASQMLGGQSYVSGQTYSGQQYGGQTYAGQTYGGQTYGGQGLQQTVQERVVSSNIVGESFMGYVPQEDNIQYIETPVIEEIIKRVPKKEYVEIEKRVPRYEYEYIDRVVEVPQLRFVDKTVEVPQVQEVVRHVGVKQYVEVPREIIRRVPKVETKIVEREIEVPGDIVEVPKPYLIENKVIIPRYTDKEVPTVVAQRLVPIVSESETEFVDVELKEYNPYLVPVDVYVPKPVTRELYAESKTEEHRVVDVPMGQFNSLIKQLNIHIQESDFQDLFVKDQRGVVPMMPARSSVVPPVNNDWEATYSKGTLHVSAANSPSIGVCKASEYSTTGYGNSGYGATGTNNIMKMSSTSYVSSPAKYGANSATTAARGMATTQQYNIMSPTYGNIPTSTTTYTGGPSYSPYSHNTPTTYSHNIPTTYSHNTPYSINLPSTYTHNAPTSYNTHSTISRSMPTTTFSYNTPYTYNASGYNHNTLSTYTQNPPASYPHHYTTSNQTYAPIVTKAASTTSEEIRPTEQLMSVTA